MIASRSDPLLLSSCQRVWWFVVYLFCGPKWSVIHTRFTCSCIKKYIFKLVVISCDLKPEINEQGQHIRIFTQGAPGRTLEELEQQIVPGSKGHAMTAEDLERQLRGEGQKPPPLPEPHLHHPPPGFLPGSHGPRNQTPQVSHVAYTD